MTPLWLAIIVAAVGCYLLKLAGVSLPESVLNHPKVQRVAQFLPIAHAVCSWWRWSSSTDGGRYALDWRTLAGVAAGVIALLLRRGFLVVFLVAIGVTAFLRLDHLSAPSCAEQGPRLLVVAAEGGAQQHRNDGEERPGQQATRGRAA